MSNVSIFTRDIPVSQQAEGVSELTKSLGGSNRTSRRIVLKKGKFRKILNGQESAKLDGELNVVIINALPKISRQFYEKAYDPNGEATLPDCWSNLGDKPDEKATNPQGSNCMTCPQNIAGSGGGTRRACVAQRRIAVLLENDASGDIYQMNIASGSLFGEGLGNTHPFESYSRFLIANNKSIDGIVTTISVDDSVDFDKVLFTPARHLTEEEQDVVISAASTDEAKNIVRFTVAAQDGVRRLPSAEATQAREDDFAPPPKARPRVEQVIEDAEIIEEPVKRQSSKPVAPVAAKQNLADVVSAWSDEE